MDYRVFYDVFLTEMPWQLSGSNDFAAQLEMLKELVADEPDSVRKTGNLNKLQVGTQTTYWTGTPDLETVGLIVDTELAGNFVKVILTSKNPAIAKGQPPFASDVYIAIKNDINTANLTFTAGDIMTGDALALWKRLHSQGNAISVFDTVAEKYLLTDIPTADGLAQYIGGVEKQRYIFVLSEDKAYARGQRHSVDLMELKRLSGYPLAEMFRRFIKGDAP